jgi:hypothetical protein
MHWQRMIFCKGTMNLFEHEIFTHRNTGHIRIWRHGVAEAGIC